MRKRTHAFTLGSGLWVQQRRPRDNPRRLKHIQPAGISSTLSFIRWLMHLAFPAEQRHWASVIERLRFLQKPWSPTSNPGHILNAKGWFDLEFGGENPVTSMPAYWHVYSVHSNKYNRAEPGSVAFFLSIQQTKCAWKTTVYEMCRRKSWFIGKLWTLLGRVAPWLMQSTFDMVWKGGNSTKWIWPDLSGVILCVTATAGIPQWPSWLGILGVAALRNNLSALWVGLRIGDA